MGDGVGMGKRLPPMKAAFSMEHCRFAMQLTMLAGSSFAELLQ